MAYRVACGAIDALQKAQFHQLAEGCECTAKKSGRTISFPDSTDAAIALTVLERGGNNVRWLAPTLVDRLYLVHQGCDLKNKDVFFICYDEKDLPLNFFPTLRKAADAYLQFLAADWTDITQAAIKSGMAKFMCDPENEVVYAKKGVIAPEDSVLLRLCAQRLKLKRIDVFLDSQSKGVCMSGSEEDIKKLRDALLPSVGKPKLGTIDEEKESS